MWVDLLKNAKLSTLLVQWSELLLFDQFDFAITDHFDRHLEAVHDRVIGVAHGITLIF